MVWFLGVGNWAAEAGIPFFGIFYSNPCALEFYRIGHFPRLWFCGSRMKYSVGDGRSSSLFVVVGCLQSPSITTPGTVTLHPEVVFGRSVQASVFFWNNLVWLCVQQARNTQTFTLLLEPPFGSSTWWCTPILCAAQDEKDRQRHQRKTFGAQPVTA